MNCTRCDGTGFLNIEQVPNSDNMQPEDILKWIAANKDHDVAVCDCCGHDGEWHGTPGEHNESDFGRNGPYAYNGGLPECH